MRKTFIVTITETLTRDIIQVADTAQEAQDIVKKGYKMEDYVLDYQDLKSVDFTAKEDKDLDLDVIFAD